MPYTVQRYRGVKEEPVLHLPLALLRASPTRQGPEQGRQLAQPCGAVLALTSSFGVHRDGFRALFCKWTKIANGMQYAHSIRGQWKWLCLCFLLGQERFSFLNEWVKIRIFIICEL